MQTNHTMKKQHLLWGGIALAVCLLGGGMFTSCNTRHEASLRGLETADPIQPVRYTGETMEIELGDYLPGINLRHAPKLSVSEGYAIEGTGHSSQKEVAIHGTDVQRVQENSLIVRLTAHTTDVGVLSVWEGKKHHVDIPILPYHSYYQGLTTLGITDDVLFFHVADDCPAPTRFVCFVQNQVLPDDCVFQGADGHWLFHLTALPRLKGRSYLRVYAWSDEALLNDLLIPLEDGYPVLSTDQLTRHDANAQVLYSILVDRFYDGNTANDAPLNQPDVDPRVDYKGGDLKGITTKIEDGFFDSLGVNTLWISPITQNPKDAWGQYHDPDTKFSGYHGYWPIFNTKIDDRMGTDAELKELLQTAHNHHINVILDYVANHMHIMSPTLQAHPDWITDSILPDGRRNFELWDEQRLTTWFDVHIPTLDLERPEVCDAMTDTALYWLDNYDFDGFRHDACKHIPLGYWRMFTYKMKSRYPDRPLWMIGETYGDNQLIGSYVKSGMLNAQFDFNIYHTAIDVLGKEGVSMKQMAKVIEQSLESYGDHHTMGNISGNHDKCRFISLAGGAVSWDEDDKAAGWHRQIGVTADGDPLREATAFKKALLLEVINLCIPGVPCIYQGDEYGQCGANDPDNRRMMRFGGLSDNEQWMHDEMVRLIHLRRTSMPLIYGDYHLDYVDDDVLVFSRTYMGERVQVGINNSPETKQGIEPYGYNISINNL